MKGIVAFTAAPPAAAHPGNRAHIK